MGERGEREREAKERMGEAKNEFVSKRKMRCKEWDKTET